MVRVGVNRIFIMTLIFFLSSCNNLTKKSKSDFSLKTNYQLNIGDTLKLYFKNNASSFICLKNFKKKSKIKYLGIKKYRNISQYCDGCDLMISYNFICLESGKEIITYFSSFPMENCDTIKNEKRLKHIKIMIN